MEDSFIISNFHTLCRLCLAKSSLMVSIYGVSPDDENNIAITSKITSLFDLQMNPNDGLPGRICYRCLFKVDKCSKFRKQCTQNEARLLEIANRALDCDNSNSSELKNINHHLKGNLKPKSEDYIVEDSVVMVVDPSMEYDSSEESDNTEQELTEKDTTLDGEPICQENFFKNIAMCPYCDQAFVSQEKCAEHELACHNAKLPYNCVECSLVFAERSQFIQHTKQVHGNNKPYHCSLCDKCFGRRSDLRKHSIVHTGIRPYQCHYCFKSFSRNTNLSKHLRIHASAKPHVCPVCPKSFVDRGDLQRHVLVHSSKKPYACKNCPLTFSRKDKLAKHELKHVSTDQDHRHLGSENDPETNDMVVNVNPFSNLLAFNSQNNGNVEYDLPRVPDHITGESSFMKQVQKKSTAVKPNQTSPPKTSVTNKNKPKNIKCHQCTKRFSSLDAYKTHVSIAHIGSRGFQCRICFKKFSRKRDLDRHFAMHPGMSYSCLKCDKKFTRKDKLLSHEATHENLYVNMPCTECGATFEKKVDLVAHIKSHFTDEFEERSSELDVKEEFHMEDRAKM